MADIITLRLDGKTRQRVARIAHRKRVSASKVIRDAIDAWVERQEPVDSPYEALSDLLGVVHGGNPYRSSHTGRQFAALRKARRSRR